MNLQKKVEKSLKWIIPISFILSTVCFTIDEINEQYWNVGWMYPAFRATSVISLGIFALAIMFAIILYATDRDS